ncbi:MAG: transglutaminase family protein [Gammaproteobacteria bacterium]|nr:transglutaminase family protein [Gammaproteobacteria bacterium]
MRYRVTHSTKYSYSKDVSLCHNVAHLLLRNTPQQTCYLSELQITPLPANVNEWQDLFGNRQASFSIQKPHDELTVTSISEVEVVSMKSLFDGIYPVSWEQAVNHLQTNDNAETVDARLYTLESGFIEFQAEVASYSEPSFTYGRPLLDAVEDLMHRIHVDFTYEPGFTTIATPLREVLQHKKGVCQDFAHLAIACLRMQGLAARYISGYLETIPPEGNEKLRGADASHAWFSVYVPNQGWVDFDPTNAQLPAEQHITAAWGRDYSDVAPLKGIVFGGGEEHKLDVAVDVERI